MYKRAQAQQEHKDFQSTIGPLVELIERHDNAAEQLRAQGKGLRAVELMENSLKLRVDVYGEGSEVVSDACEALVTYCNTLYQDYFSRGKIERAYEVLKKAEKYTDPHGYLDAEVEAKLRAITYNNFGCFYRYRGKLRAALEYLEKALKVEVLSEAPHSPASTHLNLCAVLSSLGEHGNATKHAQCALKILQEERTLKKWKKRDREIREERGEKVEPEDEAEDELLGDASILCAAYHNLAVEYEYLGRVSDAFTSYANALEIASSDLGDDHPMSLSIHESFEALKQTHNLDDEGHKRKHGAGSSSNSSSSSSASGTKAKGKGKKGKKAKGKKGKKAKAKAQKVDEEEGEEEGEDGEEAEDEDGAQESEDEEEEK